MSSLKELHELRMKRQAEKEKKEEKKVNSNGLKKQKLKDFFEKLEKEVEEMSDEFEEVRKRCVREEAEPSIRVLKGNKKIISNAMHNGKVDEQQVATRLSVIADAIRRINNAIGECTQELDFTRDFFIDFDAKMEVLEAIGGKDLKAQKKRLTDHRHDLSEAYQIEVDILKNDIMKTRELVNELANNLVVDYISNGSPVMKNFGKIQTGIDKIKAEYLKTYGEELDLELKIEMDTSRDEELARQLASQF